MPPAQRVPRGLPELASDCILGHSVAVMSKPHGTSHTIERILHAALEAAGLTAPGTVLVAAVSGGADSVAMLRALVPVAAAFKLKLFAAHLHHGIRAAADDDAGFVEALCRTLDVELTSGRADVPQAARTAHRSIEMQAREMRYAFLNKVAKERGADAVLTAHTRDDQAETLLLNLCRGTGPAALGGIPSDTTVKGVRVVRPLLQASRHDIEIYLQTAGQSWREDASNQDLAYRRNTVRHRVLPLLQETLNPNVTSALSRAAGLLRDDNALLDSLAAAERFKLHPEGEPDSLLLTPFRRLHPALRRRLLAQWLREAGVRPERLRFDMIERIDALAQENAGGKGILISSGLHILHEYDRLRRMATDTTAPDDSDREVTLTIPGVTLLPEFGCRVEASLDTGFSREAAGRPGTLPAQVYLCYSPCEPYSICVRKRKSGDRLEMIGMEGSRKVKDILIDAKVPAARRSRIPVFTINDEVVWIPGCRPSRHWAVISPEAPSLQLSVY